MSWNQFSRQRFLVKHIACSNTTAILFFYISNFSFPVETAGSCVAQWVRRLYKVEFVVFYKETYLLDLLIFLLFGHQSHEKNLVKSQRYKNLNVILNGLKPIVFCVDVASCAHFLLYHMVMNFLSSQAE